MSKRKTAAELEALALKAELRAKELREKARKETQAEEARMNADIIKAIRAWQNALPLDARTPWHEMANEFRRAEREQRELFNVARKSNVEAEITFTEWDAAGEAERNADWSDRNDRDDQVERSGVQGRSPGEQDLAELSLVS